MHMAHLSSVDLNLLPLLEALLIERHVTRAARRVGLSQPAASRGLARLRALLDDPLLVRKGRSSALSARAEALREPLRAALGLVAEALAPERAVDPQSDRRMLRIASDDYGGFVVLTQLIPALAAAAPGIDLSVVPTGDGSRQLQQGDVDLWFSPIDLGVPVGSGMHAEALAEDRFVCMVARTHPFARRPPNLARFVGAKHALIAPHGTRFGVVDRALSARGQSRRIALALPHFLAMPFMIASTELVLTVAERVARPFADVLPVTFFEPPLQLPGFTTGFYWHERDAKDPALAWVRAQALALRPGLAAAGRLTVRRGGSPRAPGRNTGRRRSPRG
jgi:DNA-binding transcriptional LysR family regulator